MLLAMIVKQIQPPKITTKKCLKKQHKVNENLARMENLKGTDKISTTNEESATSSINANIESKGKPKRKHLRNKRKDKWEKITKQDNCKKLRTKTTVIMELVNVQNGARQR